MQVPPTYISTGSQITVEYINTTLHYVYTTRQVEYIYIYNTVTAAIYTYINIWT